ncbi:MAG: Abi family protein [Elusimicrobiales bacterium]|nr:Abi family protein [Elusimicrobiales bacterium]
MENYNKEPLTIDKQIELLEGRGVKISDKKYLTKFLLGVNYYKFTAYLKSYELAKDSFDCEVEKAIKLYEFDRTLRIKIFEALSVIEIIFKTQIAYHIGIKYGKFGHYDLNNFKERHKNWLSEISKSLHKEKRDSGGNIISIFFKEIFLKYYKNKYSDYPKIPIWMFVELISFGEASKLFSNMKFNDQVKIAKYFISDKILDPQFSRSLFHIFSVTRNICAHNGRLWNKEFNLRFPKCGIENTEFAEYDLEPIKTGKLFLLINYILMRTYFDVNFIYLWRNDVEQIVDSHPEVKDFWNRFGLPENWKEHPLWKR